MGNVKQENILAFLRQELAHNCENDQLRMHSVPKFVFACFYMIGVNIFITLGYINMLKIVLIFISVVLFIIGISFMRKKDIKWYLYRVFIILGADVSMLNLILLFSTEVTETYSWYPILLISIHVFGGLASVRLQYSHFVKTINNGKYSNNDSDVKGNSIGSIGIIGGTLGLIIARALPESYEVFALLLIMRFVFGGLIVSYAGAYYYIKRNGLEQVAEKIIKNVDWTSMEKY